MVRRLLWRALPVVVAALLFLVAEGTLRELDLGEGHLVYSRDGLRESAVYLVPDPATGGWTARFAGQHLSDRPVPPKGEAPRVVVVGGSNAASLHPYLVKEAFERASGGAEWEVVNLGRGGYGTARTRRIAREALAKLEPDLLYVYTGDNDFVDLASYAESDVTRPMLRHDRRVLGLHTLGFVRSWLEGVPHPELPEPWIPARPQDRLRLSREECARMRADTRRQLNGILVEAREAGVPVLLSTVLFNRFAPPEVTHLPPELTREERERFGELRRSVEDRIPARLAALLGGKGGAVNAKDWRSGGAAEAATPPDWRRPTRPPLVRFEGDALPPEGWSERARELVASLALLRSRAFDDAELEALRGIERDLRRMLVLCPRHPRTNWRLGLVELALGRELLDVERHLNTAATSEPAPVRATPALNDEIRSLAAEHPQVLLHDADLQVAGMIPGRTTGYEWMLDGCHMALGTRKFVTRRAARLAVERWFSED